MALGLVGLFGVVGRLLRLLRSSPLLASNSSRLAKSVVGGAHWYRLRGPVGSGLTSPGALSYSMLSEGL